MFSFFSVRVFFSFLASFCFCLLERIIKNDLPIQMWRSEIHQVSDERGSTKIIQTLVSNRQIVYLCVVRICRMGVVILRVSPRLFVLVPLPCLIVCPLREVCILVGTNLICACSAFIRLISWLFPLRNPQYDYCFCLPSQVDR
jgi:hypothetical protein